MSKTNNLLFRINIALIVVLLLCKACEHWCRQYRFEGNDYNTLGLLLAFLLIFLLCRSVVMGWKSRPLSVPYRTKLGGIRFVGCAARLVSTVTFAFFACFFLYDSATYFFPSAATVADVAGQYELAERLYRLDPCRDPFKTSSAVWWSPGPLETHQQREGRTQAVAVVYGPESVEMARRDRYVADNLEINESASAAEIDCLYEKARQMYHAHGMHGCCAEALYLRYTFDSADRVVPETLLLQAADELAIDQRIESAWIPKSAQNSANYLGDLKLAHKFAELNLKCQTVCNESDDPVSRFLAVATIVILLVCVVISSGLGAVPMIEKNVNAIRKQLTHSISAESDLQEKVRALSTLIDLDMYQGNIPSALSRTEEMLHLVGVTIRKIPSGQKYSRVHRCWSIAAQQLEAFIITSMFAILWIV